LIVYIKNTIVQVFAKALTHEGYSLIVNITANQTEICRCAREQPLKNTAIEKLQLNVYFCSYTRL